MSQAVEAHKRGLNNVARELVATDGSKHYYIEFGKIWIFQGAGAVDESSHAIASASIPTGSLHIDTTNGVMSIYTGSAWETVTSS